MPKIDLKNLDKSDWKTYRFDQIVKNVSERVEPGETDLEIYIGLEHIDAESIHIKRFGQPSDVEGQKLKCYPGDVIFGKRRAYQRKASVVTAEAICSAHAFVLRANPEVIDPKLLPFFLHSDLFMHRAVDISAGGLSPTINWGVLKIQEFLLPPKEQQAELAELLWSMDEVIEKDLAVLEKLENCYTTINDGEFSIQNSNWDYVPLKTIAHINKQSLKSSTKTDYRFKYLDISSILEPKIIGELTEMTYSEAPSRARRVVSENSIVLALVRPYQKSFVKVENAENIIASTGTGVVDVFSNFNPSFVFHQFFSVKFSQFCENRMTGTSYPAITPKDLEDFEIAVSTDESKMNKIAMELDKIDSNKIGIKEKIFASKALQKSLINEVF
jgi:type I restriction enzyme, S subunit